MKELSLLGIFAHPDDEQIMAGTFALAASQGIRTGLICATRGEVGEIADPELATPDTLGQVRENELRAAVAILGIKHLYFLDYRDSGMIGTAPNDDPSCFYKSDEEEALARIVQIVREFKPTVIATFDPTGGYGHPDHLTIYKLALAAFSAAADPDRFPEAGSPWETARLYFAGFPRSRMKRFAQLIAEHGLETAFRGLDMDNFGLVDEEITNTVSVSDWLPVKEQSMNAHRTQLNPNSPFAKMPREMLDQMRSVEQFVLAEGVPLPAGEEASGDIFAGLR